MRSSSPRKRYCGVRLWSSEGEPRVLTVDVYARLESCLEISLRLLDNDERPFVDICGTKILSYSKRIGLTQIGRDDPQPDEHLANQLVSRCTYGSAVFPIDVESMRRSRRVSLTLRFIGRSQENVILSMVRRRNEMALGLKPSTQYGLPMSKAEIDVRLNQLIKRYPQLGRDNESASEALVMLWNRLRGGYDTPLLGFDAEGGDDV